MTALATWLPPAQVVMIGNGESLAPTNNVNNSSMPGTYSYYGTYEGYPLSGSSEMRGARIRLMRAAAASIQASRLPAGP